MPLRVNTSDDYDSSGSIVSQRGDEEGSGFVLPHGNVKLAVLDKSAAALTADEGFVLVDLSDTSNFPHNDAQTGKLRLYRVEVDVEKDTSGQAVLYIGVITEVDASDGSTAWIDVIPLLTDRDGTDDEDWRHIVREYYGLDLEVDGVNDKMYNVLSNSGHSGDATWKTGTSLDSPVGDTQSAPGDGDLVAYLDHTGGNIYLVIKAFYRTEAA